MLSSENPTQKMNLYFTYESRDSIKSFSLFITVKAFSKLNMERSVKLEIGIKKISRRRPRSPDHAKFSYYTLLFCKRRKKIYKDL